jgi:Tfp pilus assembly protein PilO
MSKYEWAKKIDLARFSPRERMMMLIAAAAVAVFLLVYIYLPAHRQALAFVQEREQLNREVMGLEQQLDEVRKTSERLKALKHTESGSVSGGSAALLMPYRQSLSLILEELSRLAKATGVDFLSVKPDDLEKKGDLSVRQAGLQAQSVLIDLRSTFKGMGRYLQMLENWPRLVKIQNLKMEADPDDVASVLVRLSLTVYLKQS